MYPQISQDSMMNGSMSVIKDIYEAVLGSSAIASNQMLGTFQQVPGVFLDRVSHLCPNQQLKQCRKTSDWVSLRIFLLSVGAARDLQDRSALIGGVQGPGSSKSCPAISSGQDCGVRLTGPVESRAHRAASLSLVARQIKSRQASEIQRAQADLMEAR